MRSTGKGRCEQNDTPHSAARIETQKMETLEAISGRRMYRGRLDERKLEEEVLERLVAAAGWAPSGHNSQPWEFVIVDDDALIERIAEIATANFDNFLATGSHLLQWVRNFLPWLRWSARELEIRGDGIFFERWSRSDWEALGRLKDEEPIRARMIEMFGSRGRPSILIRSAPCLVFTLLDTTRKIPDCSNDTMALTSVGAAMQNFRLAAHDLGVAVHEQSVLYDLPETRAAISGLLRIPGHLEIVGGMRLGYPAEASKSSHSHVRRPANSVTHRNGY
jgi:nitroreductase